MLSPSQRLFEDDLRSAEFRAGALKGAWGIIEDAVEWPRAILWIAAANRSDAPDHFCFDLDLSEYRGLPPTGTLWDPQTKSALAFDKFPKGKLGSRVAKVFRTDNWAKQNKALYHPYDRVAAQSHPDWPTGQPHLVWNDSRSIIDYLDEMRKLLNSGEYIGV